MTEELDHKRILGNLIAEINLALQFPPETAVRAIKALLDEYIEYLKDR